MTEYYLPLVGRNPKSRKFERRRLTVPENEYEEYWTNERELWEL